MFVLFFASIIALVYLKRNKESVENYSRYRNISIGVLVVSLILIAGSPNNSSNETTSKDVVSKSKYDKLKVELDDLKKDKKELEKEITKLNSKNEDLEKELKKNETEDEDLEEEKDIEETTTEEKTEEEELDLEFDRDYYNESKLTYDDLARKPDDHVLAPVSYTGKVLQVMNATGEKQIRLAINNNIDQTILVAIPEEQLEQNILEDDTVRIYGNFMGMQSYTTVLGAEKTVPLVISQYVDFQ